MAPINRSDPKWLKQVLEQAIADRWCTRINCTTCASEELRYALGLLDKSASGRHRFLPMTPEIAEAIIAGLKEVCPKQCEAGHQVEEAARWVLYEVWRNFGNSHFASLDGTWAGDVLSRMQAYYQRRLEARRIHDARQGVKMRNWKE